MDCLRCGGLMVKETLPAPRDEVRKPVSIWKCIQCGEAIDPVILRNRGIQQRGEEIPRSKTREGSNRPSRRM